MNKKNKKQSEIILQGEKLYKFFKVGRGRVEVIKNVDITIKKGEFVILFGPSGCGKSTLLNTLLGLEVPSDGRVIFDGENIYRYDEDKRSEIRKEKVGLIYQQQNWIKSLNVLENASFPLTLKGVMQEEREEKTLKLLKKVGMQDSSDQICSELSSGQQQKVAFVRALITNPILVVADEPTGNLDSKSSLELMQMFKDYNNLGNTIIMVTHDLEFLSYCTRSLHMIDGIIVEEYREGDKELDQFKSHYKKGNGNGAEKKE